jgi:hypothetical protein
MPKPHDAIYIIKLRGGGTQRDIHGLRFVLKQSWRRYQLKCVGAEKNAVGFIATEGAWFAPESTP